MQIDFIDPDKLLLDSFRLGKKIHKSGFIPTHAISLWRGGTPIGLGVGAYFRLQGHFINHTTVATASYTGIQAQSEVIIRGLEHVIKVIAREDRLLIIDDIYDSGKTIDAIIDTIRTRARANAPGAIMVACIHRKKTSDNYSITSLYTPSADTWISYPHEISDLYSNDDPDETMIRKKSENIHRILHDEPPAPGRLDIEQPHFYVAPGRLLEDALKLAAMIYEDGLIPDFLLALWPGGIGAGLPIHEYFKYRMARDGVDMSAPDHISINTSVTHLSYKSNIIGIQYLADSVNCDDTILIIETVFSTGRLINQTIDKLQSILRRNIDISKVRIASVYYYPYNDVTRTTIHAFKKPHYYLYEVNKPVVFPQQLHRLPDWKNDVKKYNHDLHDVLWGELPEDSER
jgi:hypoxanthine phosphoribosyltransferase